ncbi:VIR protein [Plasmodium vivax]|uniref:VIR protein n=1 Tax=Plasmodium vivax TaxID=5855 RepID=A0A1G4E8J0_PLAVI|nr:VIR protein [Plasmodium vivax]
MDDVLGDEKLRLLPSKIYYENLDKGYSGCENFNFYFNAKTELREYNGLEKVFEQILKALCYVYIQNSRRDSVNDICNFLYYWLGNILLKNLDPKLLFIEVILKLFTILKNDSNENICKLLYTHNDEDFFKKIKLIFDYTEDYVNYEINLSKHSSFCNEEYHSYLKKYVETYKELYNKCILEGKNDIYCEAFKDYYDNKKHTNLFNWSCTLKKEPEVPPLREESGRTALPRQLEGIFDRGLQSELLQSTTKAEKQQVGELHGQGDHKLDTGISETIITASSLDDKSSSITSKSITGALSVAGFLVPSYLMYNYTPAGIWISKLLGTNKGPNLNSYANQELMPNFSMPGDLYSERSRYNISYRPE